MLISLVKDIPVTYIVLDGLYKCSDLSKTLDCVSSIIREASNIHLLCLSREMEALKKVFGRYSTINLDPGCTRGDISTFLLDEIRAVSESLGRDLHAILFDQLSQDANFLWAYLEIQNLKAAPSLYKLKAMMEQVPQGLVEMYRSILSDVENETERTWNFMKKIFIWVCCSVNPLSWPELQIALAIDPKDEEFDDLKTPFKSVVLRLCNPLIEYSAKEDVFRPIHFSLPLASPASFRFTLTTSGRLDDARRWLEDTPTKEEDNLGKDSLESIWILNSLGIIYDQLRLLSLSAEKQLYALHIQNEKLPAGHLDIVWTSNELGRVYRHLSKLEEAEIVHLQALQILEMSLPKEDPHIIWTINCLAHTYRVRGKV
ncbi:hypothetical protein BP6252_10774 [Coleophoma cylindrospora]|uniref:GPI inositol-deacylase winged helix domain-containing protein n=1 Tax=Coleophoma cylindrospora TaxID=1849047 RepID=A0A3D8QTH9_9HELO|nr:hypothetical protein BP6252_10774 [Coleophoma cylindrospora]